MPRWVREFERVLDGGRALCEALLNALQKLGRQSVATAFDSAFGALAVASLVENRYATTPAHDVRTSLSNCRSFEKNVASAAGPRLRRTVWLYTAWARVEGEGYDWRSPPDEGAHQRTCYAPRREIAHSMSSGRSPVSAEREPQRSAT